MPFIQLQIEMALAFIASASKVEETLVAAEGYEVEMISGLLISNETLGHG